MLIDFMHFVSMSGLCVNLKHLRISVDLFIIFFLPCQTLIADICVRMPTLEEVSNYEIVQCPCRPQEDQIGDENGDEGVERRFELRSLTQICSADCGSRGLVTRKIWQRAQTSRYFLLGIVVGWRDWYDEVRDK